MESLIPDLQAIIYKYVHEMMMKDVLKEHYLYIKKIKSYEDLILYNNYTYLGQPLYIELSKKQQILKRIIIREMHVQALKDAFKFESYLDEGYDIYKEIQH